MPDAVAASGCRAILILVSDRCMHKLFFSFPLGPFVYSSVRAGVSVCFFSFSSILSQRIASFVVN